MDSAMMQMVGQALAHKGWGLSFPKALEQRFQDDEIHRRIRYSIKTALFALMVYDLFLVVDWFLLPDVFLLGLTLRMGIFTPAALVIVAIAHWYAEPLIRVCGAWCADWLNAVTSWLAAATIALILLKSHNPNAPLYHAGFVVVLVYGNLLQRIRFNVAVMFSVGIMAMHQGVAWLAGSYPQSLRVPMLFMLSFSAVATLVFNYALERQNRRRYLLNLQESQLLKELQQAHANLILLSQTDELTGLANRRAMDEYLKQVWTSTQSEPQAVSLLLIEVDQLRPGGLLADRAAADQCLKAVAQVLGSSVRPKDLMVRFDAQSFAAILPDVENVEAMVAADRLLDMVRRLSPEGEQVTVSIGVATAVPVDPHSSPDALVARAQRALGRATVAGRDQVSN